MTHGVSGSCVSGSPLLVRSLKRLNFAARFDIDDQIILDMVQSRWRPSKYNIQAEGAHLVAKLECVRLTSRRLNKQLMPSTLEKVASWQTEGLDIRVASNEQSSLYF